MKRPWRSAAALAVLAGVSASAEQPGAERTTTRVAALLAAADAAVGDPTRAPATLAPLLDALTRLGARPAAGDDAVTEWRAAAQLPVGRKPVWRGRVLGPAYHRGALAPAAAFRTEQLFLAGELASVSVATVPRTAVRMTVSAAGASPCAAATTECAWWPIFTQRYRITLENQGPAPVRYYVVFD